MSDLRRALLFQIKELDDEADRAWFSGDLERGDELSEIANRLSMTLAWFPESREPGR